MSCKLLQRLQASPILPASNKTSKVISNKKKNRILKHNGLAPRNPVVFKTRLGLYALAIKVKTGWASFEYFFDPATPYSETHCTHFLTMPQFVKALLSQIVASCGIQALAWADKSKRNRMHLTAESR